MTLAETIYQHSLNLPEVAAREALDFIEFLEMRYRRDSQSPEQAEPPRKRRAGSAAGRLVIVAEDNAHLDDFQDYMP